MSTGTQIEHHLGRELTEAEQAGVEDFLRNLTAIQAHAELLVATLNTACSLASQMAVMAGEGPDADPDSLLCKNALLLDRMLGELLFDWRVIAYGSGVVGRPATVLSASGVQQ